MVGTGPGWRSSTGHVLAADLIAGEQVDLTRRPRGWDTAGFDDSAWDAVAAVEHGYAGLVDSPAPPVRRVEEIVPVSVTRLDADRQIVDLGQNINGWLRLTESGPGRHDDHPDPRRMARAGRRRHHRPPDAGRAVPAAPAAGRSGRRRGLRRRPR